MPFGKRKHGSRVQVINEATGRVLGTHPSDTAADKQLAALYANVPEARNRGGKKNASRGRGRKGR